MSRLKDGKPRRFPDHRRLEAIPFNRAYQAVVGRHKPTDRLGRELAGIAADLLVDYQVLRRSKRGKPSARRKTIGLLLGALRAAGGGNGQGNGHSADDLAERIMALPTAADQRSQS